MKPPEQRLSEAQTEAIVARHAHEEVMQSLVDVAEELVRGSRSCA